MLNTIIMLPMHTMYVIYMNISGYYYADVNDCRDPRMTYAQSNDIERTSTEIRIQSNNNDWF